MINRAIRLHLDEAVEKTPPVTVKQRRYIACKLSRILPDGWRIEDCTHPVLIEPPRASDGYVREGDYVVHVASDAKRPQAGRYVRLLVNDGHGIAGWHAQALWGPHQGHGCVNRLIRDALYAVETGEAIRLAHRRGRDASDKLRTARRTLRFCAQQIREGGRTYEEIAGEMDKAFDKTAALLGGFR